MWHHNLGVILMKCEICQNLDKAAEVLYEKQYLEADELKELLKDVKDITEEEEKETHVSEVFE